MIPTPIGTATTAQAQAMSLLRISVLAADQLDEAGVVNLVGRRPELILQPMNRLAEADVLVVVAHALTAQLLRQTRDLVAGRDLPIATILERFGEVDLLTAVEVGLRGVLWRSQVTAHRFTSLIRTVSTGDSDLPREVQSRLVRDMAELQRSVLIPRGLTPSGLERREVEVLALIADGLDTAEIAERMQYSERTVKNILSGVMARLGLRNRSHAVAYALRAGLL
ncbi:response regulator transcription factor [Kineosporia sp. NBRC 101731]|uniref:helix-turn-helix transcriptional regulator n=1 Tax=Kineosporia sp. NBRC 101731 TaxID=3032199 RepID=UPI0024A4F2C6|nr:response regulator transcription factor [Kineosporia sp. NBRC 101731]GLY33201.1 helix-turn-helix transcriptional regulator [Kineosporia sp. NBRC 101731]